MSSSMHGNGIVGDTSCKENNDAGSQSASGGRFDPTAMKATRSSASSSIATNANPSDQPKRRVLLPSLGGRRPLGSASSAAGARTTAATSSQEQPPQQRRDSLDETATQHTHSSASTGASTISGNSPYSSGYHSTRGGSRIRSGVARSSGMATSSAKNHDNSGDGEHTSNSISSAISYTKSLERVLRYGETMESLFCIVVDGDGADDVSTAGSSHRTLCQEICQGEKGFDVNAWRDALELSLEENAGLSDGNIGKRLIQLHRRATSRFKLSSERDTPNRNSVLQIWLLYAAVLLKYGGGDSSNKVSNDARQTLKHVQRLYFAKCGQDFFGALMMAEVHDSEERSKDVDGVVTYLQQLLDGGVSVTELVKSQMSGLEQSGLLITRGVSSGSAARSVSNSASMAPVRVIALPTLGSKKSTNPLKQAEECEKVSMTKAMDGEKRPSSMCERDQTKVDEDRAKSLAASSYQRSKRPLQSTDHSSLKPNQPLTSEGSTRGTKPSIRAKIESRKRFKATTDRTTPHPYRSRKTNGSGKGTLSAILSQTMDEGVETDDSEDDNNISYVTAKRSADSCSSAVTAKRSAGSEKYVTAKRSADSCASAASTSSARRNNNSLFQDISPIDQEPTTSVKDMDLEYLLSWDPTKQQKKKVTIAEDNVKKQNQLMEAAPVPSKKITRNDLGYMLNWDPFAKLEKKEDGDSSVPDDGSGAAEAGVDIQGSSTAQGGIQGSNNMSTIDEATECSMTTGESNEPAVINQSQASTSSQKSHGKKDHFLNIHNGKSSDGANAKSHHGENPSRNDNDEMSSLKSKLDCSFLPLIEKKNIIHVEDEPYAKLGVIGKGGSCKVYRALARNCDVVALKKVKLDGLNKAAIDGYANEIALLKRLKGNPAIIQLYSAEVDLERKSILLVMELGEVDLNYVLRQQELLSSKQHGGGRAGKSSLNMNFIRLTWQQMLTAVHSIHEERIIHSDLKPANFLFVRGALKLIDFGIAKAIEREDTTNVYRETLSGTLSYMSPEAIMDTSTNSKGVRVNKCGRPSDIWSLGCILYQMVYGKTPFADFHGIPQKVLAITNVNHEIHFPDGVDGSAIDAMKLCLQRNPKQRPPIIGENGLLNEHCFLHGIMKSNDQR